MRYNLTSILTLALILNGILGVAAYGQAPAKKPPKLKVQNQDYLFWDATKEKPMDMPGITFPGKPAEYLNGFYNEKDGSRGARFKVPESAGAVLAYYSAALSTGGWSSSKPGPENKTSISATNAGMRATVSISTHSIPGSSGCEVYFVYGVQR